jgi:hypothetical protein
MIRYGSRTRSIGDDDDDDDDAAVGLSHDDDAAVECFVGHLRDDPDANATTQYAVVGNCVMPAMNMSHAGRL